LASAQCNRIAPSPGNALIVALAGTVTPVGQGKALIFLALALACLDLSLERLMPSFHHIKPERISLNGKRHYIMEDCPGVPDGTVLPSVTTVLSSMAPVGKIMALANWRKRIGPELAKKRTRLATDRGTWLHGVIEDWLLGDDVEHHLKAKAEWAPYFLAVEPFLSGDKDALREVCEPNSLNLIEHCFGISKPLLVESAVAWYDPDAGIGVAGTVDLLAEGGNRKLILPDWKSSFKIKPDYQLSDYKKQLGGYSLALEQMGNCSIDEAWNVIGCYDPEDESSRPCLQLMRLNGSALVCEQSIFKDTVRRYFELHYPGGQAFQLTSDRG
jgi:hypothetical protein